MSRSLAPFVITAAAALVAPAAVAQPAPGSEAPPDRRGEALARFEKGNALFKVGALPAALAEFLESRRLLPTKSATSNAALCLTRLQRFDEALDMYESLLRDFSGLPDDMKAEAQRELVRLRGLVGTVDVTGAEIGAAIAVDGQSRGDYPPVAPLRVAAGSHVVRVYKEGFEPFAARVDVAGGETARVTARLRALEQPGRLRVAEQSGRKLDVIVDGNVVGRTPWEGPVSAGDHTVLLRGEGTLGTQPASAPVRLGQLTPLTLAAEELGGSVRIEPTPAGASVAIDSVTVGRGLWEGRLRAGPHRIEVVAEGFLAAKAEVSLRRDEREVVRLALDRDLSAPMWRKPNRFTLEIGAAVPLSPSLGGDVAGGCGAGCSRSLGAGGILAFHGGYELGIGLGFGVMAGYLGVRQSVQGRAATLSPVGLPERPGVAADALALRGLLVGPWASYVFGERFPVRLRLGAGALLGSLLDERTGAFGGYGIGAAQAQTATSVYVAPEVRVAYRLGKHVEMSAGLTALVLVALHLPRWDPTVPVDARADGLAFFGNDALASRAFVVIAPGVGSRYDF